MRHLLSVIALSLFLSLFSRLAFADCSVDINTASSEQLQILPGIGPAKAAAIIAYRAQIGAFTAPAQLIAVSGIGPATMANVQAMVCVGEGGDADAKATAPAALPTTDTSSAASATAPAPATAGTVNINTASASALEALPGIGPAKAAAIVADRTDHGPFSSCNDLSRVTGIGPATVAKLAGRCDSGAGQ